MTGPGPLHIESIPLDKVTLNVSTEVIVITEDRLRSVLSDSLPRVRLADRWQAPLGFSTSFGTLLLSTNTFAPFLGLPSAFWFVFCLICFGASAAYFAWAFSIARKRVMDREELIDHIKTSSKVP